MVFIRKQKVKSGQKYKDYYYLVHNKWIKGKGPRQIKLQYIGNRSKLKEYLKINPQFADRFPEIKKEIEGEQNT